ncbi:MAG: porin [Lautropia sp.]
MTGTIGSRARPRPLAAATVVAAPVLATLVSLMTPAALVTLAGLAALVPPPALAQPRPPAPTPRELAEQLRQQAELIERLKAEIEALRSNARTLDAVEQSRRAVEQQQRQVDELLERVKAAEAAEKHRSEETQQQIDALATRADADRQQAASTLGRLQWSGYGVVNYQRYDFFENAQDRTPERRARTDLERVVLASRFDFGRGYSFHAEIEFEHGGTGATVEFEPEEAGEFESEIEKGGEVVLEHAYLQIEHQPWLNWRIGEVVVPFGMVNTHHQPTEYFTIERSLAETHLIPSVWHETGVEFYGALGQTRYQLQLVTGLDSTGFSGYEFVRGGMQRKLEFRDASSLALVARVDHSLAPGLVVGGGYYFNDSRRNRARRNLDVSADVVLAEIHGRFERGPWTLRSQYLAGRLQNADRVTQANLRVFNGSELGVSRTPIGSRANSFFIEGGYDLASAFGSLRQALGGRLDLFARYETYDTHARTTGSVVRVARYARRATTIGLNYKPRPGIVYKAEYSRRAHDGQIGNRQDFAGVSVGFEF